VFTKRYYSNVTPEGKKHKFVCYATPIDKRIIFLYSTLVIAVQLSIIYIHGNSKCKSPYIRTCFSVFNKANISVDSPAIVYKKLVSNPNCFSDVLPVLTPQNVNQVRNAQSLQWQASCLSHDAVYNLHEMAYDTFGYVQRIETLWWYVHFTI